MKINTNKKIYLTFIATLFLAFFIFIPFLTIASGINDAQKGLNTTAGEGFVGKGQTASEQSSEIITNIPTAIGKIVGAGLAFIGVIFFILMIYGGLVWMLARGNEQEVAKAKDLITSAIIGIIIVLAAYAITYYIGNILTTSSTAQ